MVTDKARSHLAKRDVFVEYPNWVTPNGLIEMPVKLWYPQWPLTRVRGQNFYTEPCGYVTLLVNGKLEGDRFRVDAIRFDNEESTISVETMSNLPNASLKSLVACLKEKIRDDLKVKRISNLTVAYFYQDVWYGDD